jgi:DNA polymerase sigma
MATLDIRPAHLELLCGLLEEHVPDAEVWAYGSRVTGTAHDGSDLDLVVRNPPRLDQPQGTLHRLVGALTESNLPILVDVLDWALLPEPFRREIARQHVVVRPAPASAPAR